MNQSNRIYRFLAFSLALLMLLTSMGFHFDAHFCQGQLKSFSLFGKAQNCYELAGGTAPETCQIHDENTDRIGTRIQQKDCCSDQTQYFASQQNQVNHSHKEHQSLQSFKQFKIACTFPYSFTTEKTNSSDLLVLDKIPKVSRDIYVFYQSFLL